MSIKKHSKTGHKVTTTSAITKAPRPRSGTHPVLKDFTNPHPKLPDPESTNPETTFLMKGNMSFPRTSQLANESSWTADDFPSQTSKPDVPSVHLN